MPKRDLDFGGGEYALVADRIAEFYARYPRGCILTRIVERTEKEVTVRAAVYRSAEDSRPAATGLASERFGDGDINKVACLENTETSAVGRALANLGFAASRRRAGVTVGAVAAASASVSPLVSPLAAPRVTPIESAAPRVVREPVPAWAAAGDRRAAVVADVLRLVDVAEGRGLRPLRAARMRARLERDAVPPSELVRMEMALRDWLAKRGGGDERAAGAV